MNSTHSLTEAIGGSRISRNRGKTRMTVVGSKGSSKASSKGTQWFLGSSRFSSLHNILQIFHSIELFGTNLSMTRRPSETLRASRRFSLYQESLGTRNLDSIIAYVWHDVFLVSWHGLIGFPWGFPSCAISGSKKISVLSEKLESFGPVDFPLHVATFLPNLCIDATLYHCRANIWDWRWDYVTLFAHEIVLE